MSRVILSLSTMALALLLLSGVSGVTLAQPAQREVLDVSCNLHGSILSLETFARSTALAAQTFEAKHTGRLTSAKVQVYDRSQPAPLNNEPSAIIMEIRAVDSSGIPTKKVEASTTIPAREVPDGHVRVATGHFRPGAPVEAGQQYALVLYPPAGGEISWGGSDGNTCPGVASNTLETHPGVFENTVLGGADQYLATYVTTRQTTGASANGGGLGATGGLPVLVPALLTLLISGAAIRLLVGRRL
jgi:hypothetical protein